MLLLPTGGPRGWGKAEGRKETLEGIFMCALGSVQKHLHTGAGVSYGCSQNPGLGRAWPRSSEMHHPDNSVQTWPPEFRETLCGHCPFHHLCPSLLRQTGASMSLQMQGGWMCT